MPSDLAGHENWLLHLTALGLLLATSISWKQDTSSPLGTVLLHRKYVTMSGDSFGCLGTVGEVLLARGG